MNAKNKIKEWLNKKRAGKKNMQNIDERRKRKNEDDIERKERHVMKNGNEWNKKATRKKKKRKSINGEKEKEWDRETDRQNNDAKRYWLKMVPKKKKK